MGLEDAVPQDLLPVYLGAEQLSSCKRPSASTFSKLPMARNCLRVTITRIDHAKPRRLALDIYKSDRASDQRIGTIRRALHTFIIGPSVPNPTQNVI